MNLMLNNYCNLNCEYCFANQVMEKDKQNISLHNILKVLDFLNKSDLNHISIIGGEPTLHPEFVEILNILSAQKFLKSILIFTNGIFKNHILDAILKLSDIKKVSILINYNDPQIIREERNKKLLHNLHELAKRNIDLTLGINIYRHNQDYNYIIEKSKELGLKNLRWSLVVPNGVSKADFNVRGYFEGYKAEIIKFLVNCRENNIQPHVDCNNIPLCLYDDEEFKKIVFLNNNSISACYPIIDILPDLSVIRCFALSEERKAKLLDFKNKKELDEFFIKHIDERYSSLPLFDECTNCISYIMKNKSCGCIAYKLNKS